MDEENQLSCVECGSIMGIQYCVECGNAFCPEHIHSTIPFDILACEDCLRVVIQKAGIHIKREDE